MGISATGKRIQVRGIDIDRLEDGKIVEHWSEASMLGVAEQLGVIGPR
jgi:predicted ester cyclase